MRGAGFFAFGGKVETPNQEMAIQQPTKLLTTMAADYGMDPVAFKNVLVKTVFPQDKTVTIEQLGMFCIVAHRYKLNPLIREIFAFPSKGGGIVPVVSVDGWISLVQRQPMYSGHKFVYEWQDGKVGGKLLAATCFIFRKDLQNPIEHTEFMEECVRPTDVWQKWPRRMLTHKSYIQCARYAFGFSGIYDEDEGERILEATFKPPSSGVNAEVAMPQRINFGPITTFNTPVLTATGTAPASVTYEVFQPATAQETPEPATEPVQNLDSVQTLFDQGAVQKGAQELSNTIGGSRAKRLKELLTRAKLHTEQELWEMFLRPLGLKFLTELPVDLYDRVCAWAEGKDAEGGEDAIQ